MSNAPVEVAVPHHHSCGYIRDPSTFPMLVLETHAWVVSVRVLFISLSSVLISPDLSRRNIRLPMPPAYYNAIQPYLQPPVHDSLQYQAGGFLSLFGKIGLHRKVNSVEWMDAVGVR